MSVRLNETLLAISAVVLSVVMGEIGARVLLPVPARADRSAMTDASEVLKPANRKLFGSLHRSDPLIGWVLTPDSMQFRHRLIDAHGAIQYDVLYSVEGGQRRTSAVPHTGPNLIAAGCSFTFGHGLNDEDSWPWLLQEKLPDYHVMNTGDMGYGTDQALLAAERAVRQHAGQTSAVVLGFGDFQIERNRSTQGWLATVYPFSKPLFAVRSGDVQYQHQVRFWSGGAAAQYSNLFASAANTFANRANAIPSHEGAKELTAALITSFAARFQALGVQFAVVMLPYIGDNSPQARADREFIVARLKAARIPTLIANLPRANNGLLTEHDLMVSSIDKHPNRRYNAILTDQILAFLQSSGVTGRHAGGL
jgi:hypothetical protein